MPRSHTKNRRGRKRRQRMAVIRAARRTAKRTGESVDDILAGHGPGRSGG